jgi:hypothetical protein
MNRRKLLLTLATVAGLLLLALGTLSFFGAWGFYRVEEGRFCFASMPPTDDELRQWLAAQPGLERIEVWRQQTPKEALAAAGDNSGVGKAEVMRWDTDEIHIRYRVRFWRKGPGDLDLDAQCGRLGYTERLEMEIDRTGMGWGW